MERDNKWKAFSGEVPQGRAHVEAALLRDLSELTTEFRACHLPTRFA
jgi:hypothetical protein